MYPIIAKFFGGATLKTIGQLAGTNWKLITIGLLVVIIGYQNISGTRWVLWADTIPYLKNRLTITSYELDLLKQANAALTEGIEARNTEIERWGDVTKQLEQNTALLQDEIAGINVKAGDQIRVVEKQIIPQECSGAMHFLYDSIPELQYDDLLQLNGGSE